MKTKVIEKLNELNQQLINLEQQKIALENSGFSRKPTIISGQRQKSIMSKTRQKNIMGIDQTQMNAIQQQMQSIKNEIRSLIRDNVSDPELQGKLLNKIGQLEVSSPSSQLFKSTEAPQEPSAFMKFFQKFIDFFKFIFAAIKNFFSPAKDNELQSEAAQVSQVTQTL